MAVRPIFVPQDEPCVSVRNIPITFQWFPGLSLSQKRKSIVEFHHAAIAEGICSKPLEISNRSEVPLGVALSAFNLQVTLNEKHVASVEAVFQSSKCFQSLGPFEDLLHVSAREAKRDERLRTSGPLVGFKFAGREWPIFPKTAFYDWIYISALQESNYSDALLEYDGFTDIEFNPGKSINCQAHAAALFVALTKAGEIFPVRECPDRFLAVVRQIENESRFRLME